MQSPVVCPAPPHLSWQKSYTSWMLKSIPGTEKHPSFKLTLCKLCCSWRWVYPDTAKSGGLWRRNSCTGAAEHDVWIVLLCKEVKTWNNRVENLTQSSLRVYLPRRPRGECRSAWRAPSTASASAGSSPLATAKEMVGKVFHNVLSICEKLTSIPCWIISLILAIAFCTLPGSSPWKPIMSTGHSPECFFLQNWLFCWSNYLNVSVKGFILPRHWLITNLL